jgi:prolyl-tRNA editing enzyme YbaK/EbsC (Cys-tRNA(Pro) deacylase)
MVWDLRGALLKKEERESARLADFEFKHRVRTMRLLARKFSLDEKSIVTLVAKGDDEAALAHIASAHQIDETTLKKTFVRYVEEARKQLIRELGSPAPHRLL